MSIYEIIEKKRAGEKLSTEEIEFFVKGITSGEIEDSAAGSFLMAVCVMGMSNRETFDLTLAMEKSGEVCDLSGIDGTLVDKHSSGGVSDSTTLIVTAIVSCLGLKVAKMSGRGLGHTGGTIDKLECFEGYNVNLTREEFKHTVGDVGASVIAQTAELVPADKRLYAVRDVSATVDSLALIASSIMSKKLASGVKNIVLDVKYGDGAFIKDPARAVELAKLMVEIGTCCHRNISALVTSMDQPLGEYVGCNLEVREVLEVLSGEKKNNLYALSKKLAAKLLVMTAIAENEKSAEEMADRVIDSGRALEKLKEIVAAHGGSTESFTKRETLKNAPFCEYVTLGTGGTVTAVRTEAIGRIVCELGGGRVKKEDFVDHSVGVVLYKKLGDAVEPEETVATVYAQSKEAGEKAAEQLRKTFILNGESKLSPLIYAEIDASGVKYDESAEKIIRRTENIMSYTDKLELEAEDFKIKRVASAIEHTMLAQTATVDMIKKHCAEAKENGFAAVCVQPIHVSVAKQCLLESGVKVCTVVGFPYGETLPSVKTAETKQAVRCGAEEIDMVISVSHAKQGDFKYITKEINKVVKAARKHTVKVIIEASQLTKEEIVKATQAVVAGGAQYVKTSTGLFGKGATAENVELIANELKRLNAKEVGIKAAGGIRDAGDVYELMNKGAARIGTSNSIAIIQELKQHADAKKQQLTAKQTPEKLQPIEATEKDTVFETDDAEK